MEVTPLLALIVLVAMASVMSQKTWHIEKLVSTSSHESVYKKKPYFLTRAEHDFFLVLQKVVGEEYYIFPQVHYSKIIYAAGQQNFRNPHFNRIDRKSADFVLFDKQNISPVLVIEVDDSSHQRIERMGRDHFINGALAECKIPIARIPPYVGEQDIRKHIQGKIKFVHDDYVIESAHKQGTKTNPSHGKTEGEQEEKNARPHRS